MAAVLTDEQVTRFHEQGYLVVNAVLDDEDLAPLWEEYSDLLDEVVLQLHDEGLISDTYADLPFASRYPRVLGEYPQLYKFLNISLPLINDEADPSDWTMHAGSAVFGLLRQVAVSRVAGRIKESLTDCAGILVDATWRVMHG